MGYTGRPVERHACSNATTFFSASGLLRSPQLGSSMAFCRSITIRAASAGRGFGTVEPDPELTRILEASRNTPVTEEELHAQRISFAFGNAPRASEKLITKDVRK